MTVSVSTTLPRPDGIFMSQVCRIVVTTGPERGKVFEQDEELVHIGRAPENQIVLEDPGLSELHATILNKNGRFAIFRPSEADIEVDGSEIPSEQWVWLPAEARLQLGRRTSCQFSYELAQAEVRPAPESRSSRSSKSRSEKRESRSGRSSVEAGTSSKVAIKAPPLPPALAEEGVSEDASQSESRNGSSRRSKKQKKKKREKQVARFITDQGGPMVELGADGNLPELALLDGPATRKKRERGKNASPVILYAALGLSMFGSMAMLLVDSSPATVSETSRADAHKELVRFFGMSEELIARKGREMKSNPKIRWPWPSQKKPVGLMGTNGEPASWQKDLRAARIARTRGDIAAERAALRRVLDQLIAEDHDQHFGLTGHAAGDVDLKKYVSIAISR
jgi:hypothetical protein